MSNLETIINEIKELKLLEVAELVKMMEEEFGVSAAAAVVAAAPGAAGAAAVEEKTEFDVVLTAAGDAKLKVVKVLKDSIGLGLKEAKDMADNVPSTVKAGCPKDEAEKIKAALEELGATVELK